MASVCLSGKAGPSKAADSPDDDAFATRIFPSGEARVPERRLDSNSFPFRERPRGTAWTQPMATIRSTAARARSAMAGATVIG
jgi:hypothetical protein